jgi:hypothetical protein
VSEAVRQANERIAEKAIRLRFVARVPFICECDDPDCVEFIPLHPRDYAERSARSYVVLPGHGGAGRWRPEIDVDGYASSDGA